LSERKAEKDKGEGEEKKSEGGEAPKGGRPRRKSAEA